MDYIILFIQAAILIITLFLVYSAKKGAATTQVIYSEHQEPRQDDSLVDRVNELTSELRKTSSRINKELAKQSALLQTLMLEADAKIAELKALETPKSRRAKVTPLSSPGPEEHSSGVGVPVMEVLKNQSSTAYNSVLKLANQGMDSIEIARQANMGRGEVELLLDLRKAAKTEEGLPFSKEETGLLSLSEMVQARPGGNYRMYGQSLKKSGNVKEAGR